MQYVTLAGKAVSLFAAIAERLNAAQRNSYRIGIVPVGRKSLPDKMRFRPLDALGAETDPDAIWRAAHSGRLGARSFKTLHAALPYRRSHRGKIEGIQMAEQVLSQPEPWRQLLTLVLVSAVIMGSPGPATISVTAIAAAFGLRGSLRYASGIILGTVAVLLVVATGIMAIFVSVPKLAPSLAIASAAYILYLAFKIATAPPLAAHAEGTTRPSLLSGFLLAIANPKAYVAIAAVLAGTSSDGGKPGAWANFAVLVLMIFAIHLLWLLAGTAFARFLRKPLASRIINLIFAATLVLTTALVALP